MARRPSSRPSAGRRRVVAPTPTPPTVVSSPQWAWAVAAATWVVHLAHLFGDPLLRAPVSAFFFADGVHFLAAARAQAEGVVDLGGALPFHPPMVRWMLVPLWRLFEEPATVYLASKVLMATIQAATLAGLFLLLRERLPRLALPVTLLLPLGFGELLLSSVANSEAPYRLLLVAILLLGWRWPLLAGLLHGAATLTRADHLAILLALAVLAVARAECRRWAAAVLAAALLVVVPHAMMVHRDLVAYNAAHAAELPEPLPTWVPVSFYGPLNFALAQREADIFFSRRTLPVSQGEAAALDPLDPVHNRAIVHGYRLGLETIAERPLRFVERSLAKTAHALRAFTYGWTWRDLPHAAVWVRRPVDMAHAPAQPLYVVAVAALCGLGLWTLRRDRTLLAVGAALVLYRLAFAVAFFSYLRGMMIATPFVAMLSVVGLATLFRGHGHRVVLLLWLTLAAYHLATVGEPRPCRLRGERDAGGTILDDRTVVIDCRG